MKYCRRCGVLYAEGNACCPRCNAALEEYVPEEAPVADRSVRLRQWIALCVGIPAMIGVFYLFFWLIRSVAP